VGRSFKVAIKHLLSMPVSCLAYSLTLKMEVTCSSEVSAEYQRTTRRCIPEVMALNFQSSCNFNLFGDFIILLNIKFHENHLSLLTLNMI
jgi:hypothetical protein